MNVTVKKVILASKTIVGAAQYSLRTIKYNLPNHLPVLVRVKAGDASNPVGFVSLSSIVYFLHRTQNIEEELVDTVLVLEEFDLPIPVVDFKQEMYKQFVATVNVDKLQLVASKIDRWMSTLADMEEEEEATYVPV